MENNIDNQSITTDYGELIIELVSQIKDKKFLQFIYEMLSSFKTKWGI